jgi:hypothetical protein
MNPIQDFTKSLILEKHRQLKITFGKYGKVSDANAWLLVLKDDGLIDVPNCSEMVLVEKEFWDKL